MRIAGASVYKIHDWARMPCQRKFPSTTPPRKYALPRHETMQSATKSWFAHCGEPANRDGTESTVVGASQMRQATAKKGNSRRSHTSEVWVRSAHEEQLMSYDLWKLGTYAGYAE